MLRLVPTAWQTDKRRKRATVPQQKAEPAQAKPTHPTCDQADATVKPKGMTPFQSALVRRKTAKLRAAKVSLEAENRTLKATLAAVQTAQKHQEAKTEEKKKERPADDDARAQSKPDVNELKRKRRVEKDDQAKRRSVSWTDGNNNFTVTSPLSTQRQQDPGPRTTEVKPKRTIVFADKRRDDGRTGDKQRGGRRTTTNRQSRNSCRPNGTRGSRDNRDRRNDRDRDRTRETRDKDDKVNRLPPRNTGGWHGWNKKRNRQHRDNRRNRRRGRHDAPREHTPCDNDEKWGTCDSPGCTQWRPLCTSCGVSMCIFHVEEGKSCEFSDFRMRPRSHGPNECWYPDENFTKEVNPDDTPLCVPSTPSKPSPGKTRRRQSPPTQAVKPKVKNRDNILDLCDSTDDDTDVKGDQAAGQARPCCHDHQPGSDSDSDPGSAVPGSDSDPDPGSAVPGSYSDSDPGPAVPGSDSDPDPGPGRQRDTLSRAEIYLQQREDARQRPRSIYKGDQTQDAVPR